MSLVLGELGTLDWDMAGEGFGLATTYECNTGARPILRAAEVLAQALTQFLGGENVANLAKSRPPFCRRQTFGLTGAGSGTIRDTACPGGGK